jgi:hypothetical protein
VGATWPTRPALHPLLFIDARQLVQFFDVDVLAAGHADDLVAVNIAGQKLLYLVNGANLFCSFWMLQNLFAALNAHVYLDTY